MCDEDRGERDGQDRFFWHIASRRTRLCWFSLHHPVEYRSSKLAGTPYLPLIGSHGAKNQSNIYTSLAQELFAVSPLPEHIDDHPVILPRLQLIQSQVHGFGASQTTSE